MFKKCSGCVAEWTQFDRFLKDPNIEIVGYQANLVKPLQGLFLFNHKACRSTISIPVDEFKHLRSGSIISERKPQSDECPEYCLYESELSACPVKCECAWVRDILQQLRNKNL